ncbi:MAG: cold shock domain-containing protein [Syntrophales bacterium]|jgi:CspA family cold shock protein|nr:cold shock domain-containing protein [Syntrophales bacterium]MDY0045515.1 cold shock domain-containing protein [Syntrophales bacterium]
MPRGTIKWFDRNKGYGYIEEDGGNQVFLPGGKVFYHDMEKLDTGRRVAFDIRHGGREPVAENIKAFK